MSGKRLPYSLPQLRPPPVERKSSPTGQRCCRNGGGGLLSGSRSPPPFCPHPRTARCPAKVGWVKRACIAGTGRFSTNRATSQRIASALIGPRRPNSRPLSPRSESLGLCRLAGIRIFSSEDPYLYDHWHRPQSRLRLQAFAGQPGSSRHHDSLFECGARQPAEDSRGVNPESDRRQEV